MIKKKAIQFEKDKIFDALCQQEAKRQAERDYWENVRNELYVEQENHKAKLKELEEKEKKQKQKEDLLASAIEQMKYKQKKKQEEQEMEIAFKKKLMEKFAEDEKLEQYNMRRRKQRELDLKAEVEKQWQIKLEQYQNQKNKELAELEKQKQKEEQERYLIEQEKKRLLKENESLLKSYYPTGYKKAINSMRPTTAPINKINRGGVVCNNIFGNSNPNPPDLYPKYGNVKNFVYDKGIQDVNANINIVNYNMYNATANNNYDSYPSQSEYMEMMKKNGQKNFAYAGGEFPKNIPMRTQRPVYYDNKYNMGQRGVSPIGMQNTVYNNNNYIIGKNENNVNSSYRPQRPMSAYNMRVRVNNNGNNNVYNNNYNAGANRNYMERRIPEPAM